MEINSWFEVAKVVAMIFAVGWAIISTVSAAAMAYCYWDEEQRPKTVAIIIVMAVLGLGAFLFTQI